MFDKFIFNQILKRLDDLKFGSIKIQDPDGKIHVFKGDVESAEADIVINDWSVIGNLARKSDIGFAEDYKDGNWSTSCLVSLLTVSIQNRSILDPFFKADKFRNFIYHLTYFFRQNSLKGSKKNIHAHYDLGNDFYKLWLDDTMTYSSALFKNESDDLVTAQKQKYNRIVDQLDSASGSVLEIGCGWGGFADQALERSKDYEIKGITLSTEQHAYAQNRLNGEANIVIEDYRHQEGKFDHIVSIEMFEAVGEKFWPTYFGKMKTLLKNKGKAVVQTITIGDQDFDQYKRGSDFLRTYIFPGGLLPSPKRFDEEVNKAGLETIDSFEFGQDYATTLEIWLKNFDNVYEKIKSLGFDDGFIRLWRFYLAGCAAAFRTGYTNVRQVEIGHAS
jgi:cyclopropane-fatty-acyl-phospholipid synthase